MQDAPIIVYAEHLNGMQAAEPNNNICVFVLKSELKIGVPPHIHQLKKLTKE